LRTPEQIVALFHERQKGMGLVVARMQRVQAQYNGDIVVPLPEMDKDEQSFVANLVQQGLDNYGMRIASRMPELTCPPTDPRKPSSVAKAELRRKANLAWWEANQVGRQLRRRARWYVGYASAPVTIRPDFKREIPRWEPRNPLSALPAPCLDPDDVTPADCIYVTKRTKGMLKRQYPYQANLCCDPDDADNTEYTVLEYDDAEQITTILIGAVNNQHRGMPELMVLESVPNRAECPLSVVPGRITLDRPMGQFDGILGMYMMQAKLMALEVLAVQKGVFPDTYLVSRPGETARIVSGPHPGYTGLINEIEGGDIKEIQVNPGFATLPTVDRLERAQRVQGGIPSDFGGESGVNIRTGRRGDSVLSSTIDFPIQEAQEMLALGMEEENYRATKIAKAYFGGAAKSFHVNWKGAKGHITYTPAKDFDSDYTQVTYPMAGTDLNNFIVGGGQRVGLGTMSKQSFMRMDPYVEDADYEHDLVIAEGIELAVLQGFQQQAAAGQIPPADAARVMQLVTRENVELAEAILRVQREAQERQAAVTSEGEPDAVDPASPEAQPGLADPGMGAEAGVAVQEPPTALGNLDRFLMQMRGTGAGA